MVVGAEENHESLSRLRLLQCEHSDLHVPCVETATAWLGVQTSEVNSDCQLLKQSYTPWSEDIFTLQLHLRYQRSLKKLKKLNSMV
jgi:hypothetical protein